MKPLSAILALAVPVALLATGGLVAKSVINPPNENVFVGKSGDELLYMKGIGRYCYSINSDKTACELFFKAYTNATKKAPSAIPVESGLTEVGQDFRASVDPLAKNKPVAVKAVEKVANFVQGW